MMTPPKYLLSKQKPQNCATEMLLKSLTPPNYRSLQKLVQRLHLQLFHKAFFNLLAHDLWPFLKVHFFYVNTCKSPHFEILSTRIKNGVGLSYGRFHSQLNQKRPRSNRPLSFPQRAKSALVSLSALNAK